MIIKKSNDKRKKYFCLFACCISVSGYKRSTICDLQRDGFMYIPNDLYTILHKNARVYLPKLKLKLKYKKHIDKLVEKEFGFYTNDVNICKALKPIRLFEDDIRPITNAVIDFDYYSKHPIDRIFNELSQLLCEAVEIRYFYDESIENIFESLKFSNDSTFRSIEIFVKFNENYHSQKKIEFLFKNINRLLKITLHSAEINQIVEIDDRKKFVIYTKTKIDSESHCGAIGIDSFKSNLLFFSEGKNFNSCLNKKISIDKKGFIKNCPSSTESFGEIKNINLREVLKIKEFKTLWSVNKDQIDDCKVL